MTQFTDRASYLTFRAAWKAQYRDLTQDIRETRKAIKEAYQSGNPDRAGSLQSQKAHMRRDARYMLENLAEAKLEAQRQYLAERETHQAA